MIPNDPSSGNAMSLARSAEHYAVALDMLRRTRRSVYIFSRQLDGRLYDTREFADALTRLATRQPGARIRILIRNLEPLIAHGHRFIELSRRLPSAMEIRVVHPDYRHFNEAFMVFDDRRIIHRKLADRYEGMAYEDDPKRARHWLDFFTEVWNVSQVDPNLRRLHL